MKRSSSWLLLLVLCVGFPAVAQDDDDLAPLAPKKKPTPVARPKPRPPPAKPPVKPPVSKGDDDDLAPIASLKGDVTVKLPQGLSNAVLSIDGKEVGPLPLGPQSLTAGEHTLKVHRLGYADFVKKVNVVAGKPLELDAKLTAINAIVSVTSDVPDAQVFINGRLVGTAPVTELEVPAGSVELAVRKDGFKDDKQRLTLVAGKDYPVSVKFNPGATTVVAAVPDRPVETKITPDDSNFSGGTSGVTTTVDEAPVTSRWYFWAGIAAAAIAIGVGAGIGVAESNKVHQLDERTLCAAAGGQCDICIGVMCSQRAATGLLNF